MVKNEYLNKYYNERRVIMNELNIEENELRNKKLINEFKKWLKNQNLTTKTINKHLSNIELFLNDYLPYYEGETMEEGVASVYSFLGDWFIRKCMWSSRTSIKETASSIKKFYKCMNELGYIDKDKYDFVAFTIKENMDEFFESLEEYENGEDMWYF